MTPRPAVVTRWYGPWSIAEEVEDAVSAVCDAYDSGATRIQIRYLEGAA